MIKRDCIAVLVAFISVFCVNLYGQNANYGYTQITINEGLAHNYISSTFKDSEGFVWVGTHYGLNRYDGYEMLTYRKDFSDTNSLSSNKITALEEDADGYVWVGTNKGLNRLDKTTNSFKKFFADNNFESIPSNQILCIENIKDVIWVGTEEGLAYYNSSKDIFIPVIPPRNDTTFVSLVVYDIFQTSDNRVYVTSENDCIHELDMETLTFSAICYKRDTRLMGNYNKKIIEDNSGNLWLSAVAHGLVRYNPGNKSSNVYSVWNSGLKTNMLFGDLILTASNELWIATDGDGIVVYDIAEDNFYSLHEKLEGGAHALNSKVMSFFIDEHNVVWLGSFNAGLFILNPNSHKFSSLSRNAESLLSGHSVLSVFEDSKQHLWLGTDGAGLFQYTPQGELKNYRYSRTNSNSLSSDRIVCIDEDSDGQLLIGTYNGGLVTLNVEENKFQRFIPNGTSSSVTSFHVWDIMNYNDSIIWLGLLANGLDLYDIKNEEFISFSPYGENINKVSHANINTIIEDVDGDLWFGTEGAGVNILDKQTGKMLHELPDHNASELEESEVRCIYQDTQGIIWIATDEGGLYRYDKKNSQLDYISLAKVQPSNMVMSIVEDNSEQLWLGMGNGLLRFDINTFEYRRFNTEDGLRGNMCNRGAICKRANGEVLVGSTKGVSLFHPDSIGDNQILPKAYISKLLVQNKEALINDTVNGRVVLHKDIAYTNQLIFKPQDKMVTFEFAASNFTLPQKCKFKYILEGFEKDWQETNADRRFATYTNLNPGKYVFRVKASNSDGVWSEHEANVAITVLPPFWRTIWFKGVLLLLLLLIVYAVYKYLLNEREKQFREEKLVDEQRIMHLEKEKLEAELNNQTFSIIGRNKTLVALRRRLSILSKRVDAKNEQSLLDIIEQINKDLNEEKDWKHIEPRLDKVYNNFMTVLKKRHADLTLSELRIAAYVRMGLSTKEISELMQKTTKAVENDRYRLRQKLDIPSNSSLKKYLLDME